MATEPTLSIRAALPRSLLIMVMSVITWMMWHLVSWCHQ